MAVGYVYDPLCLEHKPEDNPEVPQRLEVILRHLDQIGLLAQLVELPGQAATVEDLLRLHTPALVQRIRSLAERGGGLLESDTPVSAGSFTAALHAVGSVRAATQAVLAGELESAFALVRPPGHHATRAEAMGFCLFNNIALAALWALDAGLVERLAIVDIDAHHGNGTAQAFEADPRVLFVSLHEYPYYPGTGHWREKGMGPGEGTLLNIALPAYTGDRGYTEAFRRLVEPAVRRFRPELILVSAGYDAHWADPLTWMLVSLTGYRMMADALVGLAQELCRGRLVVALEGGYSLKILPHGVATTLSAMLGQPYDDLYGPSRELEHTVDDLIGKIARWHGLE